MLSAAWQALGLLTLSEQHGFRRLKPATGGFTVAQRAAPAPRSPAASALPHQELGVLGGNFVTHSHANAPPAR